MTISLQYDTDVEYPESDGLPIAESDVARYYLTYATEALAIYFASYPDIYVAGNLFIYYEQGNNKAVVAPDVFVVKGVTNQPRKVYKVWEEKERIPDFILEITSKNTRSEDQGNKKGLYAFLGVTEYFQYDPTGDYLAEQLQGYRLKEENYQPIAMVTDGNGEKVMYAETLGLELRLKNKEMRFYEPQTGKKLLTHRETQEALLQEQQGRLQEQRRRLQEQRMRWEVEQVLSQEQQARLEAVAKAERLAAKLRELGIELEEQ